MKLPTANIIVGFNREVMDRLFSQGATYKSLLNELTLSGTEDTLLFSNESNPNFISFEHSMNFGEGWKMKLVLIDPKQEFEQRFLTDNMVANVAGFTYNDQSEVTDNPLVSRINKDMTESGSKYDDKYFANLKKEYEKHFGTKELFVAYGTGNNLDLWSGPHKTVLTGADITMKGTKKITLSLSPSPQDLHIGHRRGAYNEPINLNLAGLTMRYAGESKNIEFNKILKSTGPAYNPLDYLDLGNTDNNLIQQRDQEVQQALQGIGLESLSSELGNFDFHSIIVDAIRSYIQKATNNPNVIVLIPNINLTCRTWIDSSINTARVNWVSNIGRTSLQGNFAKLASDDLYSRNITDIGFKEYFLGSLLESFGLELHSVRKEDLLFPTYRKALAQEHVNKFTSVEKYKDASERFEKYYDDRFFYAVIQKADNEGIPNHMQVLNNVFNNISKYSGEEYSSEIVEFSETDTKLLSFWSTGTQTIKPAKFSTFGGYSKFNENKEAVVVGDLAFIEQYLYAGQDLRQVYKTIKSLRSQANQALKIDNTNFYLDVQQTADEFTFASEKEFPLHPLDRIILGDVRYNDIVRGIVFPASNRAGAFGDVSFLPDEFAYEDISFNDKQKQYIREKGISVFRYNTENPNVIDMNFKFGAIYLANLLTGVEKQITRKASAVAEGVLPIGIGSLPIRTRGAAIAYLRQKNFSLGLGDSERQEAITGLVKRLSTDLANELSINDPERAADFIALYLDELEKTNLKGYVEVDQLLPGNPHSILTDFMEDMYRKALQMTIKTLPVFHIGRVSTMGSPCILIAQDTPIKQSRKEKRKLINSFYSGLYKIMGFKHTIDSGSAQSEFKLVKNAPKFGEVADE